MAELDIISHFIQDFPPPLTHDSVHIWQVNLSQLFAVEQAFTILDSNEQQRANRFIFAHHRQRYIAAHYALRLILQPYLSIDSKDIIFDHNRFGKPNIDVRQNPHSLEFNLAHSQDIALIAIRSDLPVGIDLEFISDRDYLGIAKHSFADAEYCALAELSDEILRDSFFHIWVQKEAFIKAVGHGLSYPLKKFCVSAKPPASLLYINEENIASWFIQSFKVNSFIPAAVACLLPVNKLVFLNFNDLHQVTLDHGNPSNHSS